MEKVKSAVILSEDEYAKLSSKAAEYEAKGEKSSRVGRRKKLKSITAFLFVTTQIAALLWVSLSYAIALYATVSLKQPFPVESLSEQAIITLLGGLAMKVIQNIFEHNDGLVFGTSNTTERPETINQQTDC